MPNQSPEPSGLAIAVFGITALTLSAPLLQLPELLSVGMTVGAFSVFFVDRIAFQGRVSQLLGARWSWRSPEQRQRVIKHEAGHLLAACALDIPIEDVVLDPWEAFKKGYPGYGGVQLDNAPIQGWLEKRQVQRQDVERYCILWMAGGAAEQAQLGNIEGDQDDRRQVRQLVSLLRRSGQMLDPGYMERWARMRAKELLEEQDKAYAIAVESLESGKSMDECLAAIRTKLTSVESTVA